jgi:hypothetical protein
MVSTIKATRFLRPSFFSTFFFTFLLATIFAQSPSQPFNRDEIEPGLTSLYNLDFNSAFGVFQAMIQKTPDDPTGYFALALAHWWQLEIRLGEYTNDEENQMLASINDAIDVAERTVQRSPNNAPAFLCLGGAYGLRGRWQATKHNWIRALLDGRRARRYQARALEIDPNLEDAYMGVGLFDYYVAALPKIIQTLSFLGKGDKTRGLKELERAASKGLFSKTAAQLILIGIYTNTEKTPEKALEIARQLRAQYPSSPFMHELEILILDENQKGIEMRDLSEDFIARSGSGSGYYSSYYLTRGYDHLCAAEGLLGHWDKAVDACTQAISGARSADPYRTSAYLHRGEAYDMLKERPQAVADYRQVAKGPKLWDSKNEAERYLKLPYSPKKTTSGLLPSLDNQPQNN